MVTGWPGLASMKLFSATPSAFEIMTTGPEEGKMSARCDGRRCVRHVDDDPESAGALGAIQLVGERASSALNQDEGSGQRSGRESAAAKAVVAKLSRIDQAAP